MRPSESFYLVPFSRYNRFPEIGRVSPTLPYYTGDSATPLSRGRSTQ